MKSNLGFAENLQTRIAKVGFLDYEKGGQDVALFICLHVKDIV